MGCAVYIFACHGHGYVVHRPTLYRHDCKICQRRLTSCRSFNPNLSTFSQQTRVRTYCTKPTMTGLELIEPQYLVLAVCAGFAGLSMFIYAIVSFGMREKTYEEALAEQKARVDKEMQQQQEVKQQRRLQFANRRKKEKTGKGKSPRQKSSREAVEEERAYSEEEPVPAPPENVTPRQEKKKKPAPAQEKAPEKPKVVEPPVIKPAKAKKTAAAPPPPPPVVEEVITQVFEEPVMVQRKEEVQTAAPPPPRQEEERAVPAKSKKSKHTGPSGDAPDAPPMKGKALINAVKNATLKPAEVQQIMEILISRQGGELSEDWLPANQRTDPSSALKKQLQEKEQALHKEMLLSQSNMQKLKEARAELVQEKSHTKDLETQYKNKVDMQMQETAALQRRMQQTHEQHSLETQSLQARIKQMQGVLDESNIEVVKQLREENTRLKNETNHAQQQKEQIMGAELARLQGEIQKMKSQVAISESKLRQANEMKHEYDTRIASYESKINQLESNSMENPLTSRLAEMTEEMRQSEHQKRSLAADLENSQRQQQVSAEELKKAQIQLQELCKVEDEKKALMAKFEEKEKDAEYQRQGLETKVRAVESQLKDSENTKQDMIEQIKNLKLEKTNLENQLAVTEQRSEAEGQEEPSETNGDISTKDMIALAEHQALLQEKQDSLDKLQLQITTSSDEVKKLKEEIEKQKKKNNTLRERNHTAMDALQTMEKSSEEKLKKSLQELKDELSQKLEAEQQESKDAVQRIFPEITVNQSLAHKDWLSEFEQKAVQYMKEKEGSKQESEELNSRITSLETDCKRHAANIESLEVEKAELAKNVAELQYERKQLVSQCDHYQSVLGDTEGMLNKLQSSVELEEQKWEEKLASTEKLLQQAKAEVTSLQSQVSTLKSNQQTSLDITSSPDRMESDSDDTSDYQKVVNDLASSKSTIEQLTKDRQSVAGELDDVKKQLTQLKDQLEAANQRADSNSTSPELEQLKQQVTSSNTAVQAANSTIEALKKQLEKALEQQGKDKSSTEALQKEVDELKQALQQKEGAISEANNNSNAKTTELQKELDASRLEASKAKAEVERLTGELGKTQNGAPSSEELESKTKEVEQLTASLKEEQKLKKDLGVAAGRLQMMLKKTQALLETERKTSNQLRAELGKDPEAEVSSSLTDSQLEEELAEALQESIKLAAQAAEEATTTGGTSV